MAGNLKSRRRSLLRFLLMMVLLLVPTMLSAQRGNVSLNLQDEEVSQFIRQVEKQTKYTFVYRNNVLQPKTKVTCVCKDWPLEKALAHVFSSLGIQYSFNKRKRQKERTQTQRTRRNYRALFATKTASRL